MPGSVAGQVELLTATRLNASPTHGLYSDETSELEKIMDDHMQGPICETEDYQGIRDVLGVIRDPSVIKRFVDIMKDKQVILADGHHRYAGSLAYMKWNFPDDVKALDLTVMHYFIIQEILGLDGNDQSTSTCLEYERSFAACLTRVLQREVQWEQIMIIIRLCRLLF
jgi:hypothetical protein